jgi:lysophospholipase L1-like esterase
LKRFLLILSFLIVTSCSKDPIIYTLTTEANPIEGGTISSSAYQYQDGETALITATPSTEYVFEGWSGISSASSSTSVVMNSDKFIIANFVKKSYSLTTNVEGEGSISERVIKSGISSNYNSGTIVELTAIPMSGWRFESWLGDLTGSENPIEININNTKTVTAVFKQNFFGVNSSRFLALGDSYTIGESVSKSERWPVQFLNELKSYTKSIDTLQIIARTGWRVDQLKEEMNSSNLKPPYGLVSLLIGVNNQYQNQDANDFRPQFIEILEKSLKLVGNRKERLFVISIPDWGSSAYGAGFDRSKISKEIDDYNRIIKDESEKRNIQYFDITAISRRALVDKTLIASDRLHPSGKMYKMWVDKMIPVMSKINYD